MTDQTSDPKTCLLTRWFHENYPELELLTLRRDLILLGSEAEIHNIITIGDLGIVVYEDGKVGADPDYWAPKLRPNFIWTSHLADPNFFSNFQHLIEARCFATKKTT